MKKFNLISIAVCSYLLAGCITAPMTSASLDSEAKQFTPEPGKASIYVCRSSAYYGSAVNVRTMLDGRFVGVLGSGTYQLLSVPPGEHTVFVSDAENDQMPKVAVEAGKIYFFNVRMLGRGSSLESITEEDGRKEVLSMKRAEAADLE